MKKAVILLSIWMIVSGCESDEEGKGLAIKPGIYKGNFTRTSPTGKYPASNVTIEFTFDRFSGQSDMRNFPAVCSGKYRVEGGEIAFNNECFFTADFDWTLILQGNYRFQQTNRSLVITRTQNEVTDKYDLVLQ